MLTYTIGPLLVLLPRRWREQLFDNLEVDWVRAAALSGFIETIGCMLLLVAWYLTRIHALVNEQTAVAVDALGRQQDLKGMTNIEAAYAMGLGGLITFFLHPLTWLLCYCSVEGVFRFFSAVSADEAKGTGLLGAIEWAIRTQKKKSYEKTVPLIPDKLTLAPEGKEKWDAKVESCRPKRTWKYPLTVHIRGEYFQVTGDSTDPDAAKRARGGPVRPHTFFLKRVPAGEAYRGVVEFDPNEVLKSEEPGIGSLALGALRDGMRLKSLPLVADLVHRDLTKDGVFLRITSCRPKQDWAVGRTVRFEDCYYRMDSTFDAEPPRPFGYTLRLLPAGVPGRSVIPYDPQDVLRKTE
jgi:hypothetical protein